MNLDQSFLRTLEKRDYSTDYKDQDQAMVYKVQEHCKVWLKNDLQNQSRAIDRSTIINKQPAKSQENNKFIYKQMERTVCDDKTKRSKENTQNPLIEYSNVTKQQTDPNTEQFKKQQLTHRHSMEFEHSRSPQKNLNSSHQLKQMILKLNQNGSIQNSLIGSRGLKDANNSFISKLNMTSIQDTKCSQMRSLTYREYEGFQVNLFDLTGKQIEQFTYKTQDRTTTDFNELLQERYQIIIPSPNRLIGFSTTDKKIPLDFYLTLKDRDLNLLNGTTVSLKPVYAEQVEEQLSLNSFNFLLCVGVGGFSRVFLVRCKQTGQFIALKLISKTFISENEKYQIIQNERDIMVELSQQKEPHPFLCKLVCSFETKRWVVFGVEYCPGGELFQQLKKVRKMNEPEARFYFLEVCLAILHLHQNNVIYRDIKPENILIDCDGHVKVADFGLSRPDMNEEALAYSFCGSPEYMAPEMLLKEGHNIQIDHYCLGALLYELLTGLPPYYSRDTDKIYKNILTKELSFPTKICSPEARDLITQLLVKDKSQRLGKTHGIFEILNHPWLRKTQLQSVMSKQLAPPFIPNLLTFTFDEKEISKGEVNFQTELQSSLSSNEENNFQRVFQNFYFVGPSLKLQIQVKKNRKTESMFDYQSQQIGSIQMYTDSQRGHDEYHSPDQKSRSIDLKSKQQILATQYLQQESQLAQQLKMINFNELPQTSKKNERFDLGYIKGSDSQEKNSSIILSRVCSAKQIFPTKQQQKYQSIDRSECEHFASQSVLKHVRPSYNNITSSQTRLSNQKSVKKQQTPQKTPSKNNVCKVQVVTTYLKENQIIKPKQSLTRSATNRGNKTQLMRKRPELTQQISQNNCARQMATEPDSCEMPNYQTQIPIVTTKPLYQCSSGTLAKSAYNKTLQNIFNDYNSNQRPHNQQERNKLQQNNDQSMSTLKFFNVRNV